MVQSVELIRNLKIDLARCQYKIYITKLNMENGKKLFNAFGKALVEIGKGKS
jgi:hypothetical protein